MATKRRPPAPPQSPDPEVEHDRASLSCGMLVPMSITADALPQQCAHETAQGRYVVRVLPGVRIAGADRWHSFDPATKMQTLAWINDVEERRKRVHWLCGECRQVMPLGSYANA